MDLAHWQRRRLKPAYPLLFTETNWYGRPPTLGGEEQEDIAPPFRQAGRPEKGVASTQQSIGSRKLLLKGLNTLAGPGEASPTPHCYPFY